jgi:hypothetical protein
MLTTKCLRCTGAWDSRLAVVKWLNNKSHCEVTRHKGKQQYFFRGVFPEAGVATDADDSDSSVGQVQSKEKGDTF